MLSSACDVTAHRIRRWKPSTSGDFLIPKMNDVSSLFTQKWTFPILDDIFIVVLAIIFITLLWSLSVQLLSCKLSLLFSLLSFFALRLVFMTFLWLLLSLLLMVSP